MSATNTSDFVNQLLLDEAAARRTDTLARAAAGIPTAETPEPASDLQVNLQTIVIPDPSNPADTLMEIHFVDCALPGSEEARITHLEIPGIGTWKRAFPVYGGREQARAMQWFNHHAARARLRPDEEDFVSDLPMLHSTGYRSSYQPWSTGRRRCSSLDRFDALVKESLSARCRSRWKMLWVVDELLRGLRRSNMFPLDYYNIVCQATWRDLITLYPPTDF